MDINEYIRNSISTDKPKDLNVYDEAVVNDLQMDYLDSSKASHVGMPPHVVKIELELYRRARTITLYYEYHYMGGGRYPSVNIPFKNIQWLFDGRLDERNFWELQRQYKVEPRVIDSPVDLEINLTGISAYDRGY